MHTLKTDDVCSKESLFAQIVLGLPMLRELSGLARTQHCRRRDTAIVEQESINLEAANRFHGEKVKSENDRNVAR
jgi:hypothetical protein